MMHLTSPQVTISMESNTNVFLTLHKYQANNSAHTSSMHTAHRAIKKEKYGKNGAE